MLRSNQLSYITGNRALRNKVLEVSDIRRQAKNYTQKFTAPAVKKRNNSQMTPPTHSKFCDPSSSQQAAEMVWAQWQSGQVFPHFPESCRPLTVMQGYQAQAQLPTVSGRHVIGWKIAATCMVPLALENGDTVLADFGVLGPVRMRFSDEP